MERNTLRCVYGGTGKGAIKGNHKQEGKIVQYKSAKSKRREIEDSYYVSGCKGKGKNTLRCDCVTLERNERYKRN